MNLENFKRRTTNLKIPDDIYRSYGELCRGCEICGKFHPAPERSKVTGMRATQFGDLWFIDHVDVRVANQWYCVLVVVDAMSNLVWAGPQKSKAHEETIGNLMTAINEMHKCPKAICGDSYFMEKDFLAWYASKNIKHLSLIHI